MKSPRQLRITLLLPLFVSSLVAGFWTGGRFSELRTITKACSSESKFAQIRWLLLSYHEQHGGFPPTTYQLNANSPIHSWRVLLLPYVDMYAKESYSAYDFAQEWDSPKNLEAVSSLQHFHYFSMDADDTANYIAIGAGDVWPSEKPLQSRLVTKGADRFFVVEYPDSQILWMEPQY